MDFGSVPSLVPFLFIGFSSGAVEVQHKNGHLSDISDDEIDEESNSSGSDDETREEIYSMIV